VLIRSQKPSFNHFCIQVESIDDVMRFRHNAVKNGVALRDDLLRHAPSGSIGVYLKDEARGFAIEYCVGHPQVDDTHTPRILPLAPETVDIWRSALPEPAPVADLAPGAPVRPVAPAADAAEAPTSSDSTVSRLLDPASIEAGIGIPVPAVQR
jgi:2,3-dihydroxy-p-cumate/2,3-dihydroxybenzoate 3,4-dioxygenase